jgi:hypothetical protein
LVISDVLAAAWSSQMICLANGIMPELNAQAPQASDVSLPVQQADSKLASAVIQV